MKSKLIFLGMLLWSLGSFSVSASDEVNWYAVDANLIAAVKAKIEYHSGEEGDAEALQSWQVLLDGLYGTGSVKKALRQATSNAKKNHDDAGDLWNKAITALSIVRDLQSFEFDYNIDPELVLVVQNMVNESNRKGKAGKERVWSNLLMAMMGEGNLAKAIAKVKKLKKKDRPEEWDRLIDALEGYENRFSGYAVANNAYSYDLYDEETGKKLYSLEFDSDSKKGSSGRYNSKSGKMHYEVKFAGGEKSSNYLSYGYWARSKANGDKKTYKREHVAFFHGDNPANDVDQVRGAALYRGDAVGTWKYNTTKSKEVNSFSGDVELIADFEQGNVSGSITNFGDSNLPVDKISLGKAAIDSDGTFGGRTRAFNDGAPVGVDHGEYEGGFFNQDNPTDAPNEMGGTFTALTGEDTTDVHIEGAFGTSVVNHDDTYRN